jgi:LysM repeat protein
MIFISPLNCCRRSKSPSAPVKLDHQNNFCLTTAYADCPVYQAGKAKSFPRALRERTRASQDYRPRGEGTKNIITLLVAMILLGAGYWLWSNYSRQAPASPTPFRLATTLATATENSPVIPSLTSSESQAVATLPPIHTATVTPFPSLTPTFFTETPSPTPTLTLTHTPLPTHTPTATLASSHALEVPIGRVQKYVIHRVVSGDNLNNLEVEYKTSIEAILQVNNALTIPIQQGALIVLPVGIVSPEGLPVFEPYQVTYDQITVEALADVLKTDAALLKYYNVLEDNEILRKGDWMLVPHQR